MKTVIEMARKSKLDIYGLGCPHDKFIECVERFAELVRADERNKLAAWMIQCSYATGHGDTTEDLLKELEWQVRESEREACVQEIQMHIPRSGRDTTEYQRAMRMIERIRARGETK